MTTTREIIEQARAGTLRVPEDVDECPHWGVRVGDRVAYCSVRYLPFIADKSPLDNWLEWLKLAKTGTVIGIVTEPTSPNDGPLTHEEYWASTAEVRWDSGCHNPYIKVALLAVADEQHPIHRKER